MNLHKYYFAIPHDLIKSIAYDGGWTAGCEFEGNKIVNYDLKKKPYYAKAVLHYHLDKSKNKVIYLRINGLYTNNAFKSYTINLRTMKPAFWFGNKRWLSPINEDRLRQELGQPHTD